MGDKLREVEAGAGSALADALLGTEFREPENVRLLGRLSWLRSLLDVCREHERSIEGDDPDAHREMMREVEALARDAEAALVRFGFMPAAEGRMRVTVKDNFAMAQAWGNGGGGRLVLRTVEISKRCPKRGGPRGEPAPTRMCEDGEFYTVDTWGNPCGHLDSYGPVLVEGGAYTDEERVTNPSAGGWRGRKPSEC